VWANLSLLCRHQQTHAHIHTEMYPLSLMALQCGSIGCLCGLTGFFLLCGLIGLFCVG